MRRDEIVIPNLEWYLDKSKLHGDTPRCQFGTVYNCPKYYLSMSLLRYTGTTKLDDEDDKKLSRKWKKSNLWPVLAEQEPSVGLSPIRGISDRDKDDDRNYSIYMINHFCPEVLYDRFGLFATFISWYADETDRDYMHAYLARTKAKPENWRWEFSNVIEQHYSECPLYSVLLRYKKETGKTFEIPHHILIDIVWLFLKEIGKKASTFL